MNKQTIELIKHTTNKRLKQLVSNNSIRSFSDVSVTVDKNDPTQMNIDVKIFPTSGFGSIRNDCMLYNEIIGSIRHDVEERFRNTSPDPVILNRPKCPLCE